MGATVLLYQCQGLPHPGPHPEPQSPPSLSLKWVLQCCFISVKTFPHPSPHPDPPQSKPKGVCGCYSVALSMSRASPTPVPALDPISMSWASPTSVPTLNPSPPSLSLKVCVGATVLLYQCQGLPPPQSPHSPQSKPKGVCGCYSAAVSMSRASPTPVPTPKPQSHPSLSLKVCVGATVLLYQCQGLPPPQSPP